ncbi:MAG: S41 family peptidase [Acidobacteriota bacterium]|nr:S41 family peptidase [Acidobacteriota bacterium]
MQGRISQTSNLILDLRNNGGGYVVALERLAGYFVDKDTKIADLKGRKAMKPQTAKTRGKDVFNGKLIVLIDANSGSAAEIFARFVQIEQRGVVIGDQSAGAVMQSVSVPMQMGGDSIVAYGMSLTNADVIMTDGKSLEHIGVTPQLALKPVGADIARSAMSFYPPRWNFSDKKLRLKQPENFFHLNGKTTKAIRKKFSEPL